MVETDLLDDVQTSHSKNSRSRVVICIISSLQLTFPSLIKKEKKRTFFNKISIWQTPPPPSHTKQNKKVVKNRTIFNPHRPKHRPSWWPRRRRRITATKDKKTTRINFILRYNPREEELRFRFWRNMKGRQLVLSIGQQAATRDAANKRKKRLGILNQKTTTGKERKEKKKERKKERKKILKNRKF